MHTTKYKTLRMKKLTSSIIIALALAIAPSYAIANIQEGHPQGQPQHEHQLPPPGDMQQQHPQDHMQPQPPQEERGEEVNVPEIIFHHISDAHSWSIFSYKNDEGKNVNVTIYLPIIAYYNGDFLITSSKNFGGHGVNLPLDEDGNPSLDPRTIEQIRHAGIEQNGNVYFLVAPDGRVHMKEKMYVLNAQGQVERPFDISITRNVVSMYMSVIIILLIFCLAARSYKKSEVPRGGTSLVEMLVLFVKDIADEQIGKEKSGKYTCYLLTLFYFIWINNLIGLIPFFPGSSNLSGNIAFTAILAIFTFIVTNVSGTKHYWKHNLTVPGVPAPMKVILIPIEIISMFTKPFTLLIRLFANVTGGHIIIISLISMIFVMHNLIMPAPSVILALIIFVLELIFGALQAYIFTLLSALYIGLALEDGHEH